MVYVNKTAIQTIVAAARLVDILTEAAIKAHDKRVYMLSALKM